MVAATALSPQTERTAAVLYGSETGNAQSIAEELGDLLERLRFETAVAELNYMSLKDLISFTVVIIVISTTGQGDLPANAQLFWRKLRSKKLRPGCLQSLRFASFGLGNSSYPQFNWASCKLYNRLTQLGARAIFDRAEADEQHPDGFDGYLVPWTARLREKLLQLHPLALDVSPISDDEVLPPKLFLGMTSGEFKVAEKVLNGKHKNIASGEQEEVNGSEHGHIKNVGKDILATVLENKRVTPQSHWQDVRHIILESEQNISYEPGDALGIQPRNFPKDVDHFISLMDWTDIADVPVELFPNPASAPSSAFVAQPQTAEHEEIRFNTPPCLAKLNHSKPLTLRILLTNHIDIMSIPRRTFFSAVAHFARDPYQRDRLREFTKPMYLDELYDYTTRPRRSILEVLQEFDSVKIPWQWAIHVLPLMRERQFSIASGGVLKYDSSISETELESNSCILGKTRFELLVAVVKYKTVIKRIREGICTRYLSSLQPGSKIIVTLHKGGLTSSTNDKSSIRPVIMIAPGTGIAPMRALIYERLSLAKKGTSDETSSNSKIHGKKNSAAKQTVLFFGCRNKNADYFFRDEWERLENVKEESGGVGLKVFAAFSRDQKEKTYVQDLVRKEAVLVHELLCKQRGSVYICGSSGKMPQAVREALIEAFQSEGNLDRKQAEDTLIELEKNGRYKQETW